MTSDETQRPEPEESSPEKPRVPFAWQPITPRGVSAFAHAPLRRVLFVQLLVALLVAATVVWFLQTAWFPTVRQAIRQLPDQGQIRSQQLQLPVAPPELLAEGRHLAFVVDLQGQSRAGLDSDLLVKFTPKGWEICGLVGCLTFQYPRFQTLQFNRAELEPWWDAWKPFLLGLAAAATLVKLFLVWFILATVYTPIVRVIGFFGHRCLTLAGSWKLSAAALMPGALLGTLGIVGYGAGVLDPIRLAAVGVLHLLLGWLYLVFGTLALPRLDETAPASRNPFAAPEPGSAVEREEEAD